MRYRTIVADPPWPLSWSRGGWRKNGRGEVGYVDKQTKLVYPTLTVGEIRNLEVSRLAEADAHLYLWVPDRFLVTGEGASVVEAWGFDSPRLLVWAKPGFAMGHFPRPAHEAILVARRGDLPYQVNDVGSVQTWKWPYERSGRTSGRAHSRKPDGFLDLVERASPGPYLELFARRQRLGWDTWGNEALCHVDLGTDAA